MRCQLAVATVLAMLMLPGAAGAATGWLPPAELARVVGSDAIGRPMVRVDQAGNVLLVTRREPTSTTSKYMSQYKPAGGAWQPEEQVLPQGQLAYSFDWEMDELGNAVAVWRNYDKMYARTRPAGQPWGSTVELGLSAYGSYGPEDDATVDVDIAAGVIGVVWDGRYPNNNDNLALIARRSSTGSWQGPEYLGDGPTPLEGEEPTVAVDGLGNVHGSWIEDDPADNTTLPRLLRTQTWRATGAWEASSPAHDEGIVTLSNVQIDANARGDQMLVWTRSSAPAGSYVRVRPAGASWASQAELISSDQVAVQGALAPDGAATFLYLRADADDKRSILTRDRAAGGGFSEPLVVTPAPYKPELIGCVDSVGCIYGPSLNASLNLDHAGNATIGWGGPDRPRIVYRAAGSAWSTYSDLDQGERYYGAWARGVFVGGAPMAVWSGQLNGTGVEYNTYALRWSSIGALPDPPPAAPAAPVTPPTTTPPAGGAPGTGGTDGAPPVPTGTRPASPVAPAPLTVVPGRVASLAVLARRGVAVTTTCVARCTIRAQMRVPAALARRLRVPATLGVGTASATAGQRRVVSIRLSRAAARRARVLRGRTVTILITARSGASTYNETVSLRLPSR